MVLAIMMYYITCAASVYVMRLVLD